MPKFEQKYPKLGENQTNWKLIEDLFVGINSKSEKCLKLFEDKMFSTGQKLCQIRIKNDSKV